MRRINIKESLDATVTVQNLGNFTEATATKQALPDRIVTVVEAIHSGLTRNYTFYPANNLENSVDSWTQPYNKPVIKNHDQYEEPLGRVLSASFKQSQINPDKQTIQLELEITDPDTIKKVMDGRYQTLSIGGSTNSAVCSICGKDLVKEGYCGHMKGRTYEGKQAHWIIGEMDFDEISWVNVPADRNAQVVQKNAATQKESTSTEGGTNMPENQQTSLNPEQDDILQQIENHRVTEGNEGSEDTPATPEAGAQAEGTQTPEGEGENTSAAPVAENADLTALQERVTTLEADNTTLLAERDTLTTQVGELTTERDGLQTQVESLQGDLTVAESENKDLMKQRVTLATYAHRVLAEGVASLQIVLGKVDIADKDATIAALCKETSSTLKTKMSELVAEKPQRIVQHVDNPGIVSNEGDESAAGQAESTKPTIADLAATLEKVFGRHA